MDDATMGRMREVLEKVLAVTQEMAQLLREELAAISGLGQVESDEEQGSGRLIRLEELLRVRGQLLEEVARLRGCGASDGDRGRSGEEPGVAREELTRRISDVVHSIRAADERCLDMARTLREDARAVLSRLHEHHALWQGYRRALGLGAGSARFVDRLAW